MRSCPVVPILLYTVAPLFAQTFVRVRDQIVQPGPGATATVPPTPSMSLTASPTALCATVPVATQGMVVPGAGTLQPASFMNPAIMNRAGAIAFFAATTGGSRNQGIFVADASGLHVVAIGSGGGGGSNVPGFGGDPTPIGGTFAGMFGGTVFAPPINDRGDVLFLADVVNGSSPRGLFLFQSGTGTIVKVAAVGDPSPLGGTFAAVGDPSPLGGTFAAVGPGSLNAYGEVVFLAMGSAPYVSDVFHWRSGATTTFAATGQPAPGGGTYAQLGTESFGMADGTTIPIGPVPSINACGQVAFRATVQGGSTTIGVVVRSQGIDAWHLRGGDPTPAGGTYASFQGASINGNGEIAVFADYTVGSTPTSGWFAGSPGSWREVLSFHSPVDGGQCLGLAFSRNPMQSIDDEGNVVLWCALGNNQGRLVVVDAGGNLEVLARQGGPTGTGGTYGTLDAWPSLDHTGRATIDAGVIQAGVTSPYFAAALCGPVLAASPCAPPGGTARLDNAGPSGEVFAVFAALTETHLPLPPFGELEIGPTGVVMLYGLVPYPGTPSPHTLHLALPSGPNLIGISIYFQSLRLTANQQLLLTNSARTTLR